MKKIKVILESIVTWLTIVQFALVVFSEEIAELFTDSGSGQDVVSWVVRAVAVIGSVVAIIRRVTPVLPDQVGLTLPLGATSTLDLTQPKR